MTLYYIVDLYYSIVDFILYIVDLSNVFYEFIHGSFAIDIILNTTIFWSPFSTPLNIVNSTFLI